MVGEGSRSQRQARKRHVQNRDLGVNATVVQGQIADEQLATLEHETGRKVQSIGPDAGVSSSDGAAVRSQNLDLVADIRTDVEVALHVKHDPVSADEGICGSLSMIECVAVREDLRRPRAAVGQNLDAQDPSCGGVGNIQKPLVAIEREPIRTERNSGAGLSSGSLLHTALLEPSGATFVIVPA